MSTGLPTLELVLSVGLYFVPVWDFPICRVIPEAVNLRGVGAFGVCGEEALMERSFRFCLKALQSSSFNNDVVLNTKTHE